MIRTMGFVGVVIAAVAFFACAQAIAENDLVGAWDFDEGSGVECVDASVNANHARIPKPQYVHWVEGYRGQAIELSGDEKKSGVAVVRKLRGFDPSKGMTIEARVKFDKSFVRKDACFIANMGGWKGPGFRFCVAYNRLVFKSGDGKELWGAASVAAEHGPFKAGQWYHLAGTYDGSVFRVYVDGAMVGEKAETRGITKDDPSLSIGSYGGGVTGHIKGAIDELRITNRARSAEELLTAARLR